MCPFGVLSGKVYQVGGQEGFLGNQFVLLLTAKDDQGNLGAVGIEQVADAVGNTWGDVYNQYTWFASHAGGAHGSADGNVFMKTLDVAYAIFRIGSAINNRNFIGTWYAEDVVDTQVFEDIEYIVACPACSLVERVFDHIVTGLARRLRHLWCCHMMVFWSFGC